MIGPFRLVSTEQRQKLAYVILVELLMHQFACLILVEVVPSPILKEFSSACEELPLEELGPLLGSETSGPLGKYPLVLVSHLNGSKIPDGFDVPVMEHAKRLGSEGEAEA
ncbi:hypothetical protein QCA50_017805 [Cerrena zonata]|uniref:Uncharacterized protein n=1 Tax=Cerrena zonata TaxID=2478898 RepID=A0AAW0FPL0_9APHY